MKLQLATHPVALLALSSCISCWAGPAVSIDTACSSALVGIHMGASHAAKAHVPALASGINLMLAERTTAATQVLLVFLLLS